MLVDGSMCVNWFGFDDEPSGRCAPRHLIAPTQPRRKGARLRESSQPRNFGGNPECVDRTAGSSSDISGQTIAFPKLKSLLKYLLAQSALRYHSFLPCPVSIAPRIRSC